jgi:hypothetical protein
MFFSLVVPLLEIKINGAGSFIPSGGIVSVLLPGAVIRPATGSTGEFTLATFLRVVYGSGLILSVLSVAGGLFYPVKLLVGSGSKGKVIVSARLTAPVFQPSGGIYQQCNNRQGCRVDEQPRNETHMMGHHSDLWWYR